MNGKPHDHPFTDIVVHGLDVYSPRADELVRRVATIVSTSECERLADLLLNRYNDCANPDVAALERHLESLYSTPIEQAKRDGWEIE